ncbi:MAG: FeoA family protein [Casimicrobium sp.]|jgi:ferrous iron transport protein A
MKQSVAEHSALSFSLDQAVVGQRYVVTALHAPTDVPEWSHWLEDIGFIAGEMVTVTGRSAIGGDPLVVRVGASTFALKRAEARCIRVLPAKQ